MNKVVFLIDKDIKLAKHKNMRKVLEHLAAKCDYDDNDSVVKIDANEYDSVDDAIEGEGFSKNGYNVISFGF